MDPEYIYDTELTLIYKAASELGIPANFFLLRTSTEEDGGIQGTDYTVIESLKDVVINLSREGKTLLEIYNYIQDMSTLPISQEDIAMIYLEVNSPVHERKLKDRRFLDAVTEIIQLYRLTKKEISGVAVGDEFDKKGNPSREAIESIYKDYLSWSKKVKERSKEASQIAHSIEDIQKRIFDLAGEPYIHSPIYRKSENISYKGYKLTEIEDIEEGKGKEAIEEEIVEEVPVNTEDGFFLFNDASLSEDVPFMQYNIFERGSMKSYYKIFRGETIDKEPNYKNIMIPPEELTEPDTLYMKVWFHHPFETKHTPMHLSPASSFATVEYNLSRNVISFEVPHIKEAEDSFDRYLKTLDETEIEEINILGVESVSEWVIIKAIHSAIPILLLGNREEESIKADVLIYGPEVDWSTFPYAISLDEILSKFLYIEESTHPQALKNQLSVRYDPYPINEPEIPDILKQSKFISKTGLSATIKQQYTTPGVTYYIYDLETGETKEKTFDAVNPYISLSISRTANIKAIEEFLDTFTYLLPIYTKQKPEIIDIYRKYMTDDEMVLLFEEEEEEEVLEAGELINLKAILPDLTKGGFARASQGTHKPKAIRKEDIPDWVAQTFKYHNKDYHKEVLPFPKPKLAAKVGRVILVSYIDGQVQYLMQDKDGNTEWKPQEAVQGKIIEPEAWIVCPSIENPFVGVKKNNIPSTKDKYPYIPHCYNSPQTDPHQKGSASWYQQYYLGREEKTRNKAENILITDKILKPGGKGKLGPEIEKILDQYPNKSPKGQFLRFGVPQTPNSLLHSVLLALEDPEYLNQKDKETYVRKVRKYLASQIYPALLKQELYDRSLEEIFQMFCAVDQFLDPSIFYRALEVVFNINIYTYGYATKGHGGGEGELVIPRNKIFHSQPYRARPTVLILRNWGGATDMLEYPQSELIIEEIRGAKSVMLFTEEMGKINYNVLQQTAATITWKFAEDGQFEAHANVYSEEEDQYSYPDFEELINNQGRHQILDDYGKMRGLVFSSLEEDITMLFSPSQPVNLPLTGKEKLSSCGEIQEYKEEHILPKCSVSTATKVFGNPISVTKDQNKMVTGLWFGKEIKVYVPIKRTTSYSDLKIGDPNPFETTVDNSVQRLDKIKRDLDFIQQIIWWLYLVSQKQVSDETIISKPRYHEFVAKYFTYDNYDGDSAFYYDLRWIERTFPNVNSVEEGIEILSMQEQNRSFDEEDIFYYLFKDGKVWFYNRNFYDKMVEWLRKKIQLNIGFEVKKPKVIQNYFVTGKDFVNQQFVSIFVGKRELRKWLESMTSSAQIHKIHTKITPSFTLSLEPFIFQDLTDGKIYHIQNVIGGSKSRALNVGWTWYTEKRNLGSRAPPTTINYPHLIYGDSISGLVLLAENLEGKDIHIRYKSLPVIFGKKERKNPTFYLRLLQYNLIGAPHYAAMLELL